MSQDKPCPITIVEVLISQRFPYGKDSTFFYYACGPLLNVQVGDLIEVPWRNIEHNGVVVKTKRMIINNTPTDNWPVNIYSITNGRSHFFSSVPNKVIKLKPIKEILDKNYFSPDSLLKLRSASQKYFVSWNHFSKSVVEEPVKKTRKNIFKKSHLIYLNKFYTELNRIKNDGCKVSSFFQEKFPWVFSSHKQEESLRSVLKETISLRKQVLVLVPEKSHLIFTAAKYSALTNSFGISSPVLLGKFLPRSLARAGWQLTREKSPFVFISNRSGIFAPFVNLGLIILEDGHDVSFKQWDLSPLYDCRELLALFHPNVPKIYLSDTPRLQDFYKNPYYLKEIEDSCEIKKLSFETLEKQASYVPTEESEQAPHLITRVIKHGDSRSKIILVNTKIEKVYANYEAPISDFVETKILETLKKGKNVLILINHKGIASFISCQECGHIFRCPECGKALSQDTKQYYDCRFCGFRLSSRESCPSCSGNKILYRRPGIKKIEEILLKFKNQVDFSLLSPEGTMKYSELLSFTNELINNKKPLILLGYSGIIPVGRAIKNSLGMVAILDLDELLFYSDYRSEERTAAKIYNAMSISPELYMQTSNPLQPILNKILNNPYSFLFKDWIAERKKFQYPPLGQVLRIDVPLSKGSYKDKKILDELELEKNVSEVILTPISGIGRKNKYSASIVVKFPLNVDITHEINKLFAKFGSMRIDPDPEDL